MNTKLHIQCLKLKFSRSQDKWECDLNFTYPPFKLNGFRTTGPWSVQLIVGAYP